MNPVHTPTDLGAMPRCAPLSPTSRCMCRAPLVDVDYVLRNSLLDTGPHNILSTENSLGSSMTCGIRSACPVKNLEYSST
jgi:hypothetical protein